ncbi:MAG: voltage-gated potassium channel [Cognaticolwellia sp.]|jgi:voltage-gated potassium channel
MSHWRDKIHEIIFEADTPLGKAFDIALMILIVLSIIEVMVESVSEISLKYGRFLLIIEWTLTIIFTLEYILRIISVKKPWKYITSFYGVIDFLSIVPTFLTLIITIIHAKYLIVIRALRLIRIFRIFKLARFLREGQTILVAMRASLAKITVFLTFVIVLVLIFGSLMYLVEANADSGFTNIPRSIYWAIVTITTVGYGDIAPATALGQLLAAMIMLLGYAVLAVPTGIVTMELVNANNKNNTRACSSCSREGHDDDADFCKYCGDEL